MQYYIYRNDEQHGPYSVGQLRSMWKSGTITGDVPYRYADSDEWIPLSTISDELEGPTQTAPTPLHQYSAQSSLKTPSSKRILPAFLLCFFFGTLGIHRFYCGHPVSGFIMLSLGIVGTTCMLISASVSDVVSAIIVIALGLWILVDFIVILVGGMTDENGRKISQWI
ncbi:MAG: NINE protein [Chthoniobacteraceae bacterium]